MENSELSTAIVMIKSGDKKGGANILINLLKSDPQNEFRLALAVRLHG